MSRFLDNISDDLSAGSAVDGGPRPDGVVRLVWATRPRVCPSDDLEIELIGAEAMSLAT